MRLDRVRSSPLPFSSKRPLPSKPVLCSDLPIFFCFCFFQGSLRVIEAKFNSASLVQKGVFRFRQYSPQKGIDRLALGMTIARPLLVRVPQKMSLRQGLGCRSFI